MGIKAELVLFKKETAVYGVGLSLPAEIFAEQDTRFRIIDGNRFVQGRDVNGCAFKKLAAVL